MILQQLNKRDGRIVNLKFDNGVQMMRFIDMFVGSHWKLSVVENGKTILRGRDEIMKTSNFF
jgi:hypothetical protein